jgi:hypothetical protein
MDSKWSEVPGTSGTLGEHKAAQEPTPPTRELTSRQRFCCYMVAHLANDLDRGTLAEQHTAALLRLVGDAVEHGYEAGLVAAGRAWAAETLDWEAAEG